MESVKDLLPTVTADTIPPVAWLCLAAGLLILMAGVIVDVWLAIRAKRNPSWRTRAVQRLRSRPWGWRDATFILSVLFLLYWFVAVCLRLQGVTYPLPEGEPPPFTLLALQTVLFHVTGFGVVFLIMRRRGHSWRRAFGIRRRDPIRQAAFGLLAYLAAMPAVAAAAILYRILLLAVNYPIEPQGVTLLLTDPANPRWVQIFLVVLAVAVAPIVEEILFRGVLLTVLARYVSWRSAVVCSSLLFASAHFHVPSFVPLFAIGAAFAMSYIRTGSLLVPIVMHAVFNGVSLAAMFLLKDLAPLAW